MRKSALFAMNLLGLFDSSYLWWAYTTASRPMACIGGGCDVVRASTYAHFLGLPLPVFGVGMYAMMTLNIFSEPLAGARAGRGLRFTLALISGSGFLVSLYLTGVEAVVLHAWCVWCVVSFLLVTVIFLLAILEVVRPSPYPDGPKAIMTLRRYTALLGAAVVLAVPGFLLLAHSEKISPEPELPAEVLREHLIRPDSHFFGNPDAPVTVVEFADFECPYCGQMEKTVRRLRQAYASQVKFVFRQLPLPQLHRYAEKAAEASECAADQGQFWPAVENLYDHQDNLSVPDLERYGTSLGLEATRFDQCLSSGATAARVARDVEDARALRIRVTPTFFIEGRRFEGGMDYYQFGQIIDREIANRSAPGTETAKLGNLPDASSFNSAAKAAPTPPQALSSGSSSGFFSGGPANIFTQVQGTSGGCSEDEAKLPQPTLITTSEARLFFQTGGKALFVDVRPPKEFKSARIPGAISVPLDDIARRLGNMPKDRSIVFYEAGRADGAEDDVCAASRAAGRFLLAHGFSRDRVKVYQGGLKAWEKAGMPVERGGASGS